MIGNPIWIKSQLNQYKKLNNFFLLKFQQSQGSALIPSHNFCYQALALVFNRLALKNDASWISWQIFVLFGFGLKLKNWIDNLNPKFNFENGLSITMQST